MDDTICQRCSFIPCVCFKILRPCEHGAAYTDERDQLRCVACNIKLDEDTWEKE